MFERVFEDVPWEVRKALESQLEAAVSEAVRDAKAGGGKVLSCVLRMSEIMILAGTLRHGARKRSSGRIPDSKEEKSDGSSEDGVT